MGNPINAEPGRVYDVTLSMPAEAFIDGDVLADAQEIEDVSRRNGSPVILQSVTLLDQDDQGIVMDLIFLDTSVVVGVEGSAVSITDANATKIVGTVSIPAANYVDLIASQVATVDDIGLMMQPSSSSTSLWIAAVTGGTPTHTAAGIKLKLSFLQMA